MKADTAGRLAAAYDFLRRVEHRIQYLDDQQTHLLPTADADLAWIAASMGLACRRRRLRAARPPGRGARAGGRRVRRLLGEGQAPQAPRPAARQCGPGPQPVDSEACSRPAARAWPPACGPGRRTRACRPARRRAAAPGAAGAQDGQAVRDGSVRCRPPLRFIDWMEPLLRRESYLALLVERPDVQRRLLRLLDLARWPMQYLMRHPGVIDELADERLLHLRFDRDCLRARARRAPRGLAAIRRGRRGDAARHAAPRPPRRGLPHAGARRRRRAHVEQVADDLSALADAVLEPPCAGPGRACASATATTRAGRHRLRQAGRQGAGLRQRPRRRLPVRRQRRARQGPRAEVYGAFVRKLITWLTLRTAAGELFDIDTALAAQRQLGPAGDLDRLLRDLPGRPRQQHRLDLGAPGDDARALRRRLHAAWPARFEATRRAVLTARATPPRCARRCAPCARRCAGAPGAGGPVRRQAQRRRHDGRGVRGAVPGAGAGAGTRAAGQRRQHRAAAARRGRRPAARRRGHRRGRRLPRAAPRPAPGAPGRTADPVRPRVVCGAA
jgi:glutamate-ammonia-ligase adenylyltransferase